MIDACKPWIEAALAYSGGTHTFEDVKQGILSGEMQLWPAEDGCCVTEIIIYPRHKSLNVCLAGGVMDRITDMIPTIEEWAQQQGCSVMEWTGRRGWTRVFASMGYREAAVNLRKELK